MGIEVVLLDGPCRDSVFETDAYTSWLPPKEIRVVSGGKNGPELLDLPEDEPRPGEQLHTYRRISYGTYKAGRRCGFMASYLLALSAPVPQPSLFEAGIRPVT